VIQYNQSLDPSVRNALEDFTRNHDTRVLTAPRDPKYNTQGMLWLTAWQHMISCNTNPTSPASIVAAADGFYKLFAGKSGPEGDIPGTPVSS
jgi:hypothetical protein